MSYYFFTATNVGHVLRPGTPTNMGQQALPIQQNMLPPTGFESQPIIVPTHCIMLPPTEFESQPKVMLTHMPPPTSQHEIVLTQYDVSPTTTQPEIVGTQYYDVSPTTMQSEIIRTQCMFSPTRFESQHEILPPQYNMLPPTGFESQPETVPTKIVYVDNNIPQNVFIREQQFSNKEIISS